MFQYHCLNPIAEKGLGLFDEEYKKSEDLQECDAVLVRSAKMHDMELPESVKVIARAGKFIYRRKIRRICIPPRLYPDALSGSTQSHKKEK